MEKRDVFTRLSSLAQTERQVVVATIVRAYGSTPREVGAKMVVLENGEFFGTIGGGCGEAEVWQQARRVFRSATPRTVHVDLTEDPDKGGDAICGGRMDVFIDLWGEGDLARVPGIVRLLDEGRGVSLATVMEAPAGAAAAPGTHVVLSESEPIGSLGDALLDAQLHRQAEALQRERKSVVAAFPLDGGAPTVPAPRHGAEGALEVFVEVIERPPVLVIAGAGHCALPLAKMGKLLGFYVIVLDDRPECATRERFPDADEILLGDLEREVEKIPMDRRTHVVLVTRGHKLDEAILRKVVRNPLGYVGMIGSKRRVRAVFRDMERDGFAPEHLARVSSPIGLDIGAETPEEIAVCILAEVIMARKGGTGLPMSRKP
ncbi:MAG: XdhC family protein [Armatimonadetes bacterium]|nr:XdhC family protein [Armatimonadota bacterium]